MQERCTLLHTPRLIWCSHLSMPGYLTVMFDRADQVAQVALLYPTPHAIVQRGLFYNYAGHCGHLRNYRTYSQNYKNNVSNFETSNSESVSWGIPLAMATMDSLQGSSYLADMCIHSSIINLDFRPTFCDGQPLRCLLEVFANLHLHSPLVIGGDPRPSK